MPDEAQITRSLSTIKTELEYLSNSGVLSAPQLHSIQAQLPVCFLSLSLSLSLSFSHAFFKKREKKEN
jgi:hypothetical protein